MVERGQCQSVGEGREGEMRDEEEGGRRSSNRRHCCGLGRLLL